MTASEALSHPWLKTTSKFDVYPNVKKNFHPRKTFKKAVNAVLMSNKMSSLVKLAASSGSVDKKEIVSPSDEDFVSAESKISTTSAGTLS